MRAGDTFRFVRGDSHLWMVISDPTSNRERVLIVNATTWKADKDQACLINAGEHVDIVHASVVHYRESRVHADVQLNHLINTTQAIFSEPLSANLLARVREGAMRSRFIRLDHAQLLIDQELVDI